MQNFVFFLLAIFTNLSIHYFLFNIYIFVFVLVGLHLLYSYGLLLSEIIIIANTHTHRRHRSGCRCSMCRWRPTVTQLTPLFDGSLAINGRSLVHSNKHKTTHVETVSTCVVLCFSRIQKLLGRTETRPRERKCFQSIRTV